MWWDRLRISSDICAALLQPHFMEGSLHALLLLSDTALPLGSFAFSSGLESFLAHNNFSHSDKRAAFQRFLDDSLDNLGSTALPYVLTAYRDPSCIAQLDNDFDASTPCTVARRASISQGRALLTIWERALIHSSKADHITELASAAKDNKLNAHFPPLFGIVCCDLGVSENDTAYLFLLNHAKAVLSAAVRASVMGPYQSQAILAGSGLQSSLKAIISRYKSVSVSDAGVSAPAMDLWMGRHELLYSRIFNS